MAWVLPGGAASEMSCAVTSIAFVNTVAHQRVSGLVLDAVRPGCPRRLARRDSGPDWSRRTSAALRSSLAAEAASVTVSDLFRSAGVRHAVLKGCATAQLDYPDPAMRVTGDVDVLIGRDDYALALAPSKAPGSTGWRRRSGRAGNGATARTSR